MQIPDSPEDLGLVGYPEWREHQQQVVQEITDAFEGTSRVLLEAPTGAGKTIIAAAVARALGGSALYLAHTIILQQQQLRTLPEAVTCTGRGNHDCLTDVGRMLGQTAADADCPCPFARLGGCGYYDQWFRALRSQDVVLNYAFVVRVLKGKGLRVWGEDGPTKISNPFRDRELMVCDEGHNLEAALLDADGVDIYERSFDSYGVGVPRSTDVEDWFDWVEGEDVRHLSSQLQELTMARAARKATSETPDLDAYKHETKLKQLLQSVSNLSELGMVGNDTPIYVGRTPYGYRIRPLWAWNRSNKILFQYTPKTIVMSATLGEPKLAARLLGLDNWTHVRIPSTFPPSNRPVFYWPVARMKHGMPESDKARQILALIHLARKFPSSPGVVHTNSFALASYLRSGVEGVAPDVSARLIVHDSNNRERVFAAFEQDPDSNILLTPSATTGVDWDFVGWQMIPKVPYPDLSDEFTRLRYDYQTPEGEDIGKQVYQQEAVKTLVQAAGRCVRTPTSKGVTIITDSAFWPLYKHIAPGAFPDWFRAAVQWYEPKQ